MTIGGNRDPESFMSALRSLAGLIPPADHGRLILLVLMLIVNAALEVIGVGVIPVYIGIVAFPEQTQGAEILAQIAGADVLEPGILLWIGSGLILAAITLKSTPALPSHSLPASAMFLCIRRFKPPICGTSLSSLTRFGDRY